MGTKGQLYASTDTVFTNTDFQRISRKKTPLKVFKRAKVLLNHLGITLQNPAFDSRLARYLLSTVRTNEISTIASLYSQIAAAGRSRLWQGVKKSYPEKAVLLEHLARKVAVYWIPKSL